MLRIAGNISRLRDGAEIEAQNINFEQQVN